MHLAPTTRDGGREARAKTRLAAIRRLDPHQPIGGRKTGESDLRAIDAGSSTVSSVLTRCCAANGTPWAATTLVKPAGHWQAALLQSQLSWSISCPVSTWLATSPSGQSASIAAAGRLSSCMLSPCPLPAPCPAMLTAIELALHSEALPSRQKATIRKQRSRVENRNMACRGRPEVVYTTR